MNMSVESGPKPATVEPPLLAGLIRSEVIEGAEKLKTSLAHLERMHAEGVTATTHTGRSGIAAAYQQAARLLNRMEMVAGLAETYAGQSEDNQERFFLSSLTKDILKSRLGAPPGRFVLKEPDRQVGPVYGNTRWLELMLTHLLHELDRSIHSTEQRIVLTLRQLGNHIVMCAQNESMPQPVQKHEPPAAPRIEGLTLSLCRRIAELHGGTLSADTETGPDADELSAFVLSLPTSSPQTQDGLQGMDCSLTRQIEHYAADLAELIDHCRELEQARSMNDGQTVDR
jgi:hypothetical protein